jgi:hypothetical protein
MNYNELLKKYLIWTNPLTYVGMVGSVFFGITFQGIKEAKDYIDDINETKIK